MEHMETPTDGSAPVVRKDRVRSKEDSPAGSRIPLNNKTVRLTTTQPARHPAPTTKATALAYLLFERPDLALAEKFLTDFGLKPVERQADRLFLRDAGQAPYCYVVERANKPRFVGFGVTVSSLEDLRKLAAIAGASNIEDVAWPGGGKCVRLTDPSGFRVEAVWGQATIPPLNHRRPILFNSPDQIVRVDGTQRPPAAPPDITKLGHVLIEVADYQETCAWYTQHLGMIPSDVCVLPDGSPAATFFRLDLGDTPADHHTLAVVQGFMPNMGHCSFELIDADAVGMGQRVMRNGGWKHAWGIGRHILGSQIFDYWTDPWGSKHEHYCDGDLFTSKVPMEVHSVSRDAMAQWGPKMPKSFTKPDLGVKSLAALAHNLYRSEDLTLKKLIALIRLVA